MPRAFPRRCCLHPAPWPRCSTVTAIGCGRCSRPNPKKLPETDAIFANIQAKEQASEAAAGVMRPSIDCKATVKIGEYSRGGKTRGDHQAADHDMGWRETYTPFGVVNEDTGELPLTLGISAKTSDFIVDALQGWWEHCSQAQRDGVALLQIKADNGPQSNGQRTQFLKRMVEFADAIGKPIQLL